MSMLRSTHRAAPAAEASDSLPAGWTEHKAPTGHTYYYNAATKQSTYTRPAIQSEPESDDLQIDYNATAPDQVVQASMKALDEFHKNNKGAQRGQGHFTGGRSYQDRSRHGRNQDRPKSKAPIPNCSPWVLVKTKLGRRFVHNTETKESFWKFPQDVMMAVIDMDRVEWESKRKAEDKSKEPDTTEPTASSQVAAPQGGVSQHEDYDSDEYEEVEVTDDEADPEAIAKRARIDFNHDDNHDDNHDAPAPAGPVEFDEDDIAWQLAQMEGSDTYDDDLDNLDGGEDEEGLPLTAEDSIALFRSLLDDNRTDPYSTFDALIEYNNASIIDDPRWVSLPNMSSRRAAFAHWSRDRVAELKHRQASAAATHKRHDPRAAYLNFLLDHATPKLYWPEFKRKFKKEPEMKDLNYPDKDREKLYREYIPKLKMGDGDRKREFRDLLKAIPLGESWNRKTTLEDLPDSLMRDLRFYVIRDKKLRDELVEAHIQGLKDA